MGWKLNSVLNLGALVFHFPIVNIFLMANNSDCLNFFAKPTKFLMRKNLAYLVVLLINRIELGIWI